MMDLNLGSIEKQEYKISKLKETEEVTEGYTQEIDKKIEGEEPGTAEPIPSDLNQQQNIPSMR